MDKFQNKYRIPSARLQNWDYGCNAPYFVTICTGNRECYFGEIRHGEMFLSEIGQVANDFYIEIPSHFPFVTLDTFQIMPNHVHGIIVIDKPDNGPNVETPNLGVSTNPISNGYPMNNTNNKWKPDTLGVIINQYKRICTIHSRKINPDFGWQSRFHDHIIRDNKSYERIRNYIINNPKNWRNDKFYP